MIPAAELIAKRTGGKPADAVQLWSRFLQVWMKLDIDGPARWLQGRAGSPGYEAATAAFVREVKAVDPAAGKAWADTLKTPEFRKLAAE